MGERNNVEKGTTMLEIIICLVVILAPVMVFLGYEFGNIRGRKELRAEVANDLGLRIVMSDHGWMIDPEPYPRG